MFSFQSSYPSRRRPLYLCAAAGLAAAALWLGAGIVAGQDDSQRSTALTSIVFVSRAHPPTLNNYDVGPPVEVIGREMTVGGKLCLLKPNGEVVVLAGPHNGIYDAQRPAVSFDGARVAFAGVKARNGMWRIFDVGLDGTGLRQVTPEARGFDIPDDPARPRQNQSTFGRYSDLSPAYLPDGRIVFSSSRYPSVSGSCGQRAFNLYVINSDGSDMRRIVSTRSGALAPSVMANGRILLGLWFDNMNMPSLFTEGIQPLETDVNFQPSFFEPWSANPDGTGLSRLGYLGGPLTHGPGAGLHFREMPNGEIVYTRRATASFLGSTLATAIAKFRPGDGAGNVITGIGDPVNLEAPHALLPSPLPDGRILFSYTPGARVWKDDNYRTMADFDFGIYVCDGDFSNMKLVYDNPGTEELDAVAVYPRTARVIPDEVRTPVSEDPTTPPPGVTLFINRSVYADVDRRFTHNLSPLPGSVVAIDVYDDAQTFFTTPEFPLVRKQMPRPWKSFPVNEDGSFIAEIPSDRPSIIVLRSPTGVAARYPLPSTGEMRTPFFGHEVVRSGEVARCAGCHRGHMIRPELNRAAKVNLARLAVAVGSSALDASLNSAARINDGHIGLDTSRYQWIPRATDVMPWIRLEWERDIIAREILIYPRPQAAKPIGEVEVYLSDGRRIAARSDSRDPAEPVLVTVPNPGPVRWAHAQLISHATGGAPGIAEITVSGDPSWAAGAAPPAPPPSVTVAPVTMRLSWSRSPSPSTLGYKILAGTSPDRLPLEWDAGNVTSYQPENLDPDQKYWFRVQAYDASRFGPPYGRELTGIPAAPRVDSITPPTGSIHGETEVTIEGANFASGLMVKVGGQQLRSVRVHNGTRITGVTFRQAAGTYDVVVRNPGKLQGMLPRAYRHE